MAASTTIIANLVIRTRAYLRNAFKTGAKPTEDDFNAVFNSYWHKTEDLIPIARISGLDAVGGQVTQAELDAVIADLNQLESIVEIEHDKRLDDLENGYSAYAVSGIKRQQVAYANKVFLAETSEEFLGKRFFDDVTFPGRSFHFTCEAVCNSAGATVYYWIRTEIIS